MPNLREEIDGGVDRNSTSSFAGSMELGARSVKEKEIKRREREADIFFM